MEQQSINVYRDLKNLNHYPKFETQTKNPIDATYSDVDSYFGEDEKFKVYATENRNFVEFDRFEKLEKSVESFKNTLFKFDGVENHLFFFFFYIKQKI